MKRILFALTVVVAATALISSCLGIFYTDGGESRTVENIYGEEVTLFGDGIYANNSVMKVGATKGADALVIVCAVLLLVSLLFWQNKKAHSFLRSGLLLIILYSTTCLIMGVEFNRLFLLYVLQFGCAMFAFILSLREILNAEMFRAEIYEKHLKGTGIFLLIAGCSALIWFLFIIPSVVSGRPLENIEIYTTEPAYAIDLAIVLPSSVFCGISLLKKKYIGFKLVPVLLVFFTGVGLCVIFQTAFQASLGIVLSIGQLIGLVVSFVILGSVAAVLNVRLLKYAK